MVEQLLERAAERDLSEAQRRQLAAAASHDVRTPLTSLRLLADALRDGLVDPDELPAHASRMLSQIAVLHRLTEQVFELARLEAGDVAWDMVEADPGQLLRETADQLEIRAAEHGLSLVVDIDARVPAVLVAPDMVLRVVVNLVQNAIEHTPAGGRVRLAARSREDAWVQAEVSDTGSGIAGPDREKIFEPFFRGDRSRTGTGTGLGLSIAQGIVEAHPFQDGNKRVAMLALLAFLHENGFTVSASKRLMAQWTLDLATGASADEIAAEIRQHLQPLP